MRIGLHDAEKAYLKNKTFPNLALMKISAYHKSLGDAAVEKITKGIVKRAGVEKIGTVHVFRRTFATRCVERGLSIEVVQDLMGHSDPATTLRYYIAKAGLRVKAEWERHVLCAA